MEIVKLAINKKIFKDVMLLLKQFKAQDLRIIEEETDQNLFLHQKTALQDRLNQIDENKARFMSLDDLDRRLERTISSHENQVSLAYKIRRTTNRSFWVYQLSR